MQECLDALVIFPFALAVLATFVLILIAAAFCLARALAGRSDVGLFLRTMCIFLLV